MTRGDSMAGLLYDIWKCLGLLRLQSVSLCLVWGPKPELWVVLLVGVSSNLTQRWKLVCRKFMREFFGGHHMWKGGKGSRTG